MSLPRTPEHSLPALTSYLKWLARTLQRYLQYHNFFFMYFDLITHRNIYANFSYGVVYEIEDLLVKYCGANLINPVPRKGYKQALRAPSWLSKQKLKLLRNTIKYYHPIRIGSTNLSAPKILGIVCLNGANLMLLEAIQNWRQHYDIVFAYVLDCWVYDAYPKLASNLDHVFIPFPEVQNSLQAYLNCPVSVVPYGANNLHHCSVSSPRSIDVISYGRMANDFHQKIFHNFNTDHSDLFYYQFGVGTTARSDKFPTIEWGENRFDYQNRWTLPRVLRRSKIALAFENLYTRLANEGAKPHAINRTEHSFLTLRWFECSGAGCAVLGKHPHSSLLEKYMGWEDSTIELPDDIDAAIEMIHSLLADSERLAKIHHRNVLENLALNDWCYRFKSIFDILELPIPDSLSGSLEALDQINLSRTSSIVLTP